MKRKKRQEAILLLVFIIVFTVISGSCRKEHRITTKNNIDKLISSMTLEEKVGQMTQLTLAVVSKGDIDHSDIPQQIDTNKLKKAIIQYHIGSLLNVINHAYSRKHWREILHQIQNMTNRTRLKIPVLYGIDAIHGANYTLGSTLFPQEIGQAATWNPQLVKKAAEITAYETRASGIPWVFSPVLGVGKQPLWPRLYETFGEDTYLASTMATAIVKGYEGNNIANKYHVASCMKHYMGYSFPLSGKDRTPAWIPENYLREYFLPPFNAAVKAGAHTLMVNSSSINGIPVHANYHILTEILRKELHFKGLAVSDWGDIENLYKKYHFVNSEKEAVKVAVMAGVDMSMVPYDFSFPKYLVELVKEGQVPESRINQAVKRILLVKKELGLFNKFMYPEKDYPKFASTEFKSDNLKIAQESITLLKNNHNILPLRKKHVKIFVTGFAANSMATLNGGWTYTWQGNQTDHFDNEKSTILKAIQSKIGKENVLYSKGTLFNKSLNDYTALKLAKKADYIVLCLGEMPYAETPGNINDLYLPDNQVEYALKLAKTGKPVILVLTEGRPRIISKFAAKMNAIIMAYLPGNQGGNAIADVLFGDVNPSGKLPITYPRFPNSLENYNLTYDQQEIDTCPPQFPFGFGLSYTTFRYSHLKLNSDTLYRNKMLKISIDVTNTGGKAGKEVVQLYVGETYRRATIMPCVKRLKGFSKIFLLPGETKTVSFSIKKTDLMFINRKMKKVIDPGFFKVYISNLSQKFYLE